MEAGYDYLLMRGRVHRRFLNSSGIFIIVLGALLLISSGGYYAYAAAARADLQVLNASEQTESPNRLSEVPPAKPLGLALSNAAGSVVSVVDSFNQEGMVLQSTGAGSIGNKRLMSIPASAIAGQQTYPGDAIDARSWNYPASYEPLSYVEGIQLQGFSPLAVGETLIAQANATRIIIPSIGVDSPVQELGIVDLAGSRAYETPANTVGHIPKTANAGEAGNAWFFGHTESPLSGEGSVFYNLTQLPGKLNQGEDVYIITENGQNRFLYRVTSTKMVHQSELKLFESGEATIHLVSCVPSLVYDYRLVVNGELVGRN